MEKSYRVKHTREKSDEPVKIINIDFCQFEDSIKCTWLQLIMIRNNSAYFSFASHFR